MKKQSNVIIQLIGYIILLIFLSYSIAFAADSERLKSLTLKNFEKEFFAYVNAVKKDKWLQLIEVFEESYISEKEHIYKEYSYDKPEIERRMKALQDKYKSKFYCAKSEPVCKKLVEVGIFGPSRKEEVKDESFLTYFVRASNILFVENAKVSVIEVKETEPGYWTSATKDRMVVKITYPNDIGPVYSLCGTKDVPTGLYKTKNEVTARLKDVSPSGYKTVITLKDRAQDINNIETMIFQMKEVLIFVGRTPVTSKLSVPSICVRKVWGTDGSYIERSEHDCNHFYQCPAEPLEPW